MRGFIAFVLLTTSLFFFAGCNSTAGSGKYKDDDKPRASDQK